MEYGTVIVVAMAVFLCGAFGFLAERFGRTRFLRIEEDEADISECNSPLAHRVLAGRSKSSKTEPERARARGGDSSSSATKTRDSS